MYGMKKHVSHESHSEAVAMSKNVKEWQELDRVKKFWDRCKDQMEGEMTHQEKELLGQLQQLQRDQERFHVEDNRDNALIQEMHSGHTRVTRQGSQTSTSKHKVHPPRKRSSKSLKKKANVNRTTSKLKPGRRLDPEVMSPPNAHDVAVRILCDNNGVHHHRRRKQKLAAAIPDALQQKSWHQGQTPKLPDIKQHRRGSLPADVVTLGKGQDSPRASPRRQSLSGATRPGLLPAINHQPHASPHYSRTDTPTSHKQVLREEELKAYYDILAENEHMLREIDQKFDLPSGSTGPLTTSRSGRQKDIGLEAVLKQLPCFKKRMAEFNPQDLLNCSYLRLSKNNIAELEDQCKADGKKAGLHCHMSVEDVENYFEKMDSDEWELASLRSSDED